MNNKKENLKETAIMLLGEVIVSLLVCGVFLAIGKFDFKVVLGAVLGSAATVVSYLTMLITTGRAFDRAMEARGDREMSEEEAEEFAAAHRSKIQAAVQLSSIVRSIITVILLVLSLTTKQFNVISTIVPLLAFKPILMVRGYFGSKIKGGES